MSMKRHPSYDSYACAHLQATLSKRMVLRHGPSTQLYIIIIELSRLAGAPRPTMN